MSKKAEIIHVTINRRPENVADLVQLILAAEKLKTNRLDVTLKDKP